MNDFPIGEVARRTGLSASALRYYEQQGLLPAPRRVAGRRRFGAGDVQRIHVLRFARQAGFTLSEIKKLFQGFEPKAPLGARWRVLAEGKLLELDALQSRVALMRRAIEHGLECGCTRIEDCSLAQGAPPERAAHPLARPVRLRNP